MCSLITLIAFGVCRYFHVLVQKMAVNVDLGFILAILDFIEIDTDPLLEVRED